MGIFADALETRSSLENPATSLSDPAAWLFEAFGVLPTDAGIPVSPQSALRNSTVWACVSAIAQDVAQNPWDVYRTDGKRRDVAVDRSEHYLLHNEPNGIMTSYQFRLGLLVCLLLYGNTYAEILRDGASRTKAIRLLLPPRVRVYENPEGTRLVYQVTRFDGTLDTIDGSDIIHIPCISLDGVGGLSPIAQHRQAIGLDMAAERAQAAFFANGSRPSGYLYDDNKIPLPKKTRDEMAETWKVKHAGSGNSGSIPVMSGGLKWQQLSIPPQDAQYIQSRQFQVLDIARIFHVPGVRIGIHEKTSSYASVEQFLLSYVKFTLSPHVQSLEQEFNRKLFPNRTDIYTKIDLRGLMRGDSAARAAYMKALFEMGALSPNDILEVEDMNPIKGGDQRFVQQNLMPLDKAAEIVAGKSAGGAQNNPGNSDPKNPQSGARSAHVAWLRSIAGRVGKWETRNDAKVVAELRPVFQSLAGDDRDVRPFCERLLPDMAGLDADAAIDSFLETIL